jgi:hypothetical protein
MSKARPITKAELNCIRLSVAKACEKFLSEHTGLYFMGEAPALVNVDMKFLLRAYQFELGRILFPLNGAEAKGLVLKAIDAADIKFFVRLGKVLSKEALPPVKRLMDNDLEGFLITHWAKRKDGLPELFYLTPDALTLLCREKLGKKGLSRDVVVKTRQRLGLMPFKRQKREAVFLGGRWTFPQVDKK